MEKKKIIIPVVTIAVIGAVGGTGYYYRDNVIDVATEAFDVVAEKIPFLQSGKSDDKVYVEKVSKIMNTYTGNTNRYNGVVESQDSYEVNVDSSRTIKEILVKVGDEVEEGRADCQQGLGAGGVHPEIYLRAICRSLACRIWLSVLDQSISRILSC